MKRVLYYMSKMAHLRSVGYRDVVKTPPNLYELCLTNLVNYLQRCKCDRNMLRTLPDTILIDVYFKVSVAGSWKTQNTEITVIIVQYALDCDKFVIVMCQGVRLFSTYVIYLLSDEFVAVNLQISG